MFKGIGHYESVTYSAVVRSLAVIEEFDRQFPPDHPQTFERDTAVMNLAASVLSKVKGAAVELKNALSNYETQPTDDSAARLNKLAEMLTKFVRDKANAVGADALDWVETGLQPLKKHPFVSQVIAEIRAEREETR